MCGILGFFNRRGIVEAEALQLAERMGRRISLRGPDDHGEWCDPAAGIVFGQRRLSINDLSPAGHQPMVSASGRFVIVLNGEIYNFLELRKELEAQGHSFRGHSDTEVALTTIEQFGLESALGRFVGMFALGLWDREERALHLARDRVGEKPLYYGRVGDAFAFASDLNALREMPQWSPSIDRDALGLMMQHFYIPAPRTIYTDLCKLPPGTWLRVDFDANASEQTPRSYWSAPDLAVDAMCHRRPIAAEAAIDELDGLLRQTIRDKMISDVPLGAFLSGGIDSSTVVAMMQAESNSPVRTFSIGFHEDDYNEATEAKRVAHHLGTDHTELYVSPDEARAVIPKLPSLYSEPFADSSQIPTYLVSQLARREVTVALSGDGGDELFGGYVRYLMAEELWRRFERLPRSVRNPLGAVLGGVSPATIDTMVAPLKRFLPERLRYKQFGNKVQKLSGLLRAEDPISVYRSLISMWEQPSRVVNDCADVDLLLELPEKVAQVPNFTERMMLIDLMTYLPGDILAKVDRASMGESLEVRVPFLDHRVIEHAWRVPLDLKVRDGDGKWLLRQVLYRYVPRELIDRPKMGFGVPVAEWLRGPLREWADTLIEEVRLRQDGYFKADIVRDTWLRHQSGREDCAMLLWPILMFQAWHEHYEQT